MGCCGDVRMLSAIDNKIVDSSLSSQNMVKDVEI